ncbi:hypothetical protein EXIGLDRAFT_514670 [Exidia glandulosa HHB12029]|uniref:PHD-type domain-containing protein n=1 Tax=Exidia glandulosa HHB12029 TaxID=1314781 RepID=A0A165PGD6_EXIGL|nr:hypothetical protein EXIGLDRAFT_514670 [Exidia glandulosa HHB12029]
MLKPSSALSEPKSLKSEPVLAAAPTTPRAVDAQQPQSGSKLDNLAAKLSATTSSKQIQHASLLPPFPAGERSHLPTPHSVEPQSRRMPGGSPESPSIPVSSRSHTSQHDSQRRSFLPSPASIHPSQSGRSVVPSRANQFTPSPSPATLSSPSIRPRAIDAVTDAYDVSTPTSSPARNHLRDANLHTPSSPERQDSLPRTPAHPHAQWEVAHVASSPMDLPSTREARIERSFARDDIHSFIPSGPKAPPIVAPPPPPRSHFDDDDMLPPPNPAKGSRSPRPRTASSTSSPSTQSRPLADVSPRQSAAGTSRSMDTTASRDLPQTPRMRRIAPASEVDRLRDTERAQIEDGDQMRPDYLKRAKRPREAADTAAAEREEREQALPGLGVHVSPSNGRRLKLYQPPTPDARAPPRAPLDGPSTPSRTFNAMSSRARAWLEAPSPLSRPRTRPGLSERTAAKDAKKRKRLAAFEQEPPSACALDIYEVQGRGRILVGSDAAKSLLIVSNPDTTVPANPSTPPPPPDWPDEQYPWVSVRASGEVRSKEEEADAVRNERMKWIERFLDRESDDDEDTDESSSRASRSLQSSPLRGKGSPKSPGKQKTHASETASDARAALFSRREVRKLTEVQHSDPEEDGPSGSGSDKAADEDQDDDDGIVRCICGGDEDDRPMVACDRCAIWFHQVCMGIKNSSDLDGQDKWYCFECRKSRTPTPPPPPQQPVFSVSSPDTHVRPSLDKPLFQTTPLQSSPAFFGAFGSPIASRARERERDRDDRRPSSSWFDTPQPPTTPFRRGDRESRLFRTPGGGLDPFDDGFPPMSMGLPFDTPSRGLGFTNVPFATPTQPTRRTSGGFASTSTRTPGLSLPLTPRPGGRISAADDPVMSSSPLERFARVVGEETPLASRKLPPRAGSPTPMGPRPSSPFISSSQDPF